MHQHITGRRYGNSARSEVGRQHGTAQAGMSGCARQQFLACRRRESTARKRQNGTRRDRESSYLNIFTESRRVVVTSRFCVTKRFEYRICGENLTFDLAGLVEGGLRLATALVVGRVYRGEITHDELGRFCLPRTTATLSVVDSSGQ